MSFTALLGRAPPKLESEAPCYFIDGNDELARALTYTFRIRPHRLSIVVACAIGAGCAAAGPRTASVVFPSISKKATSTTTKPSGSTAIVAESAMSGTSTLGAKGDSPEVSPTSDAIVATVEPEPEPTIDVSDPADDPSVILADAYGALDDETCLALLKKRGIPFVRVDFARGVETPIRFTGPLHGVDIHGGEKPELRATSPNEIVDCRLALAFDSFAVILAKNKVKEAVHWSIYRAPPAGEDGISADHRAALAVDLGALFENDGSRTGVMEDWHGEIGGKTCGKGLVLAPSTKRSWRLRAILCETVKARIFNLVLTPNFNAAHHDHFHLEIKRNSTYSFVK